MERVVSDLPVETQGDFRKLAESVYQDMGASPKDLRPHSLHRFFTSSEYSFEAAQKKIRHHLDWRRTYDFERAATLEKAAYQEIHRNAEIALYGLTRDGFPIGYIRPRTDYPFGVIQSLGSDTIIDYQVQMFERLNNIIFPMCSEKSKKNINKMVCVVDLRHSYYWGAIKDPALWKFAYRTMIQYRDNYPEMNRETILINTNWFFSTLWGALLPYIMPKTLSKITFAKNGKHLEELLKHADLDQIPEALGGTCKYPIEQYPNFWDPAVAKSVKEGKLSND